MGITVLYGPALAQAAAGGQLDEMRALLRQAEEQLAEQGNLPAAIEVLRAEIAKAEARGGGGASAG